MEPEGVWFASVIVVCAHGILLKNIAGLTIELMEANNNRSS
jgi:dipeptide/tripeptide permease